MKVFVFDLLAYDRHLDHLKVGAELPYPLGKAHFDAATAVRTYEEHLQAWEEMDRLGYGMPSGGPAVRRRTPPPPPYYARPYPY